MAAVLIIAHAPLASALAAVAQHTFPDAMPALRAVDVTVEGPVEWLEEHVRGVVRELSAIPGSRQEVLLLTDVFGATPCNVAQRVADGVQVRCVTGANVPMLWRTLNYLREPLDQLVTRALAGGTQGVMQIASARPQNQTCRPSHDQDHRHHQQ